MVAYCRAYKLVKRRIEIPRALKLVGKAFQRLRDGGVYHYICLRDRFGGAEHAEFEFVSRECKGRRAVAVRRVAREFRQRVDTDAHSDFLARIVCRSVFDRRQYLVKLLSEEDRDYRGGSLLRAEAVVVRRRCHGYAEQVLIIVDRFDHRDKK